MASKIPGVAHRHSRHTYQCWRHLTCAAMAKQLTRQPGPGKGLQRLARDSRALLRPGERAAPYQVSISCMPKLPAVMEKNVTIKKNTGQPDKLKKASDDQYRNACRFTPLAVWTIRRVVPARGRDGGWEMRAAPGVAAGIWGCG